MTDDYDPDDPIFDDEPGGILCVVQTCPGCGLAVLAAYGDTVTGCDDHMPKPHGDPAEPDE